MFPYVPARLPFTTRARGVKMTALTCCEKIRGRLGLYCKVFDDVKLPKSENPNSSIL